MGLGGLVVGVGFEGEAKRSVVEELLLSLSASGEGGGDEDCIFLKG